MKRRSASLVYGAGRRLGRTWEGLALALRPLLEKELRSRPRSWRFPALLSLFILAFGGAFLGLYLLMTASMGFGSPDPQAGLQIFTVMSLIQVLMVAFTVPAITCGAVSGERERRTFDLLLVTQVSPAGLVLGKLLSSLVYVLLLLVVTLPVFAFVYFFGGVPLATLFAVLGVSMAGAVTFGAVGIFCSAAFRRTQGAAVAAYALTFLLVVGSLVVTVILANIPRAEPQPYRIPPVTAYISPVAALASVAPGQEMTLDIQRALFGPVMVSEDRAVPVMQAPAVPGIGAPAAGLMVDEPANTPEPPKLWAPWAYHLLWDGILTASLLALATLMISPVKPWHRTRRNRQGTVRKQEAVRS